MHRRQINRLPQAIRPRLINGRPVTREWQFARNIPCPPRPDVFIPPPEGEPGEDLPGITGRIKTIDHGLDPLFIRFKRDNRRETEEWIDREYGDTAAVKSVRYWCENCLALMLDVIYYTGFLEYRYEQYPRWREDLRSCFTHTCPGAGYATRNGFNPAGLDLINFMIVNGRYVPFERDENGQALPHTEAPLVIPPDFLELDD